MLEALITRFGHGSCDLHQVSRLVAPRLWLRRDRSRQQVWCVGLDQQPIIRNDGHDIVQVSATSLVADPAGDADV
jgi:hypothetical protein